MTNWYKQGQRIGDIFLGIVKMFKVYTDYVNNYNAALEEIRKQKAANRCVCGCVCECVWMCDVDDISDNIVVEARVQKGRTVRVYFVCLNYMRSFWMCFYFPYNSLYTFSPPLSLSLPPSPSLFLSLSLSSSPSPTLFLPHSEFRSFLKNAVAKCNGLDILSFLVMPIQRLPRYVMLLEDMFKHTPDSHPDHADLGQVVIDIRYVADYVNDKKRAAESLSQVRRERERGRREGAYYSMCWSL